MELFSVKRYDEEMKENDPEKEVEILQKLLKKVEKRKRKLAKDNQRREGEEFVPDINVDIENKAKRRELIENDQENIENIDAKAENVDKLAETPTEPADFQILGDNKFKKKHKIDMILPSWLAYPTIISNVITQAKDFQEKIDDMIYISPQMKANLKSMSIERFFPVQQIVIPWILEAHSKPFPFRPRDICVSAPTGSGKTLAFAIPIIELLSKRVERKIRALIVLPVNELAVQVYNVFKKLCERTDLTVALLSKSFPFVNEQKHLVDFYDGKYYSRVDIVVTTPGRLVEHLQGTIGLCFKSLKFLVVDEADRIMEQAHHNWLYHLDEHVKTSSDTFVSGRSGPLCLNELENYSYKQPHKLLYSATLSSDPEKLQNLKLFQPKLFTSVVKSQEELLQEILDHKKISNETNEEERRGEFIGKYTTPAELTEKYCITEARLKPLTLFCLINENKWKKFLCFTNSGDSAHRLSYVLQRLLGQTLNIEELSANLKPHVRKSVLNGFIEGKVNGLISSDALTRGIDIPDVDIVISYDAPRHIKTYIHRVGRTARAGRPGTAITILTAPEMRMFNKILNDAGKTSVEEIKVDSSVEEQHASNYVFALKALKKALESEQQLKIIREKVEKGKGQLNNTDNSDKPIAEKLQSQLSSVELKMKNLKAKSLVKAELKGWLTSCRDEKEARKYRKKKKVNKKKVSAKKVKTSDNL